MYVCLYVCMYTVYMSLYIYIYTYVCVDMYMYIYIYVCVCTICMPGPLGFIQEPRPQRVSDTEEGLEFTFSLLTRLPTLMASETSLCPKKMPEVPLSMACTVGRAGNQATGNVEHACPSASTLGSPSMRTELSARILILIASHRSPNCTSPQQACSCI